MAASPESSQVLVVGGGAMGCAVAWALARRGAAVRVLERFDHVHDLGSHGGFTRVIRHAYHEGAGYVRLVDEADRQWQALGERHKAELLARRGLLEFGPLRDPGYAAALASLDQHAVAHERLGPREAAARWPVQIPADWDVSFTPQSGFLRVGPCMDALRAEAQAAGAVFSYGARVVDTVQEPAQVGVRLETGELIVGDKLVLAAGAYTQTFAPSLLHEGPRGRLHALRRVLAWTMPAPRHRMATGAMPVWAAFTPRGFYYGFPFGNEGVEGFKLAGHRSGVHRDHGAEVDPDAVDRNAGPGDVEALNDFLSRYIPAASGPVVRTAVCMYGQSQDGDFVVDLHPDDPRVCVCAGFSGHGFKFAPTIGLLVADLLERGSSTWQLPRFRFAPA